MSEQRAVGPRIHVPRGVALLLVIGGVIGELASFILTEDKLRILADPSYRPACSINATFSCASVMTSPQASLFGFPNSLIGLIGFAVVITLGVLALARVAIPRSIWWGLQIGVLAAVVFVHWLMVQSLYDIGALCLYCMAVWGVTIPIFWFVTQLTLATDRSRVGDEVELRPTVRGIQVLAPALWLAVIGVLVFLEFG